MSFDDSVPWLARLQRRLLPRQAASEELKLTDKLVSLIEERLADR